MLRQWVEVGDVEVNIGGNPSAEGGDDEAVDPSSRKVVDIIDAFRLAVRAYSREGISAWHGTAGTANLQTLRACQFAGS